MNPALGLFVQPGIHLLAYSMLLLGLTWGAAGAGPPQAAKMFDHSAYDALLKKYVDDKGLVAYRTWKAKDLGALEEYLKSISETDPAKLASKEERIAFWINTYNALTIQGMIEFYPLKSIKDKVSRFFGYNIWDDYKIKVDGKERSLNDIEHKILRKMGEPRIHFALVCASIGCPKLSQGAYGGKDLDDQLADQARTFLNDAGKTRLDLKDGTAHLSKIFDWFEDDFGGSDDSVLKFIAPYRPEKERGALLSGKVDIEYLEYDWSLNDQEE